MKRRTALPALRFSTQTLLLQLGVVVLVVLLSGAVHAWLTYDRLGREAEERALRPGPDRCLGPLRAGGSAVHQCPSPPLPRPPNSWAGR